MSIKNLIKTAIVGSGGFIYKTVYHKRLAKALVVFCYHDVSNVPSEFSRLFGLNVLPEIFDYQVRFIKKNFNLISTEDIKNNNIPQRAALVTFDDGFKSYFTNAVPILNKHNVPSIIFLNMAPILGDVFWPGLVSYLCEKKPGFREFVKSRVLPVPSADKFLFLSSTPDMVNEYCRKEEVSNSKVKEFIGSFADEDDLNKASSNHLVFYGNHLYAHEAAINLTDQALWESFTKNDSLLRKYSNHCNMFSFPFGQPGAYYLLRQPDFLLSQGVKAVFNSNGLINFERKNCFSRIALTSFHSSELRLLFGIYNHAFMKMKYWG